jgi:hypothetical protein
MHRVCRLLTWLGIFALLAGCNSGPKRVQPVSIDSSSASSQAIELYDKDGDGAIAGNELDAVPGIKKYLGNYDRDGDQRVTRDEIAQRLNDWSSQRLALSGASVAVKLDGQWLDGATVTFVPEPYLGPNVKPASGVTLQNGYTMVSHADEDLPKSSSGRALPGIFSGTYKIQITHPSRSIPSKYNKATELGEEVAYDINTAGAPVQLNLMSK